MRVLCVENSAILKRTTRALFVSRPFFLSLSLSLSLSLESKANTKVVSKLSCERVFMRKRPTAFLRERERERERVFTQRVRKSTTTRDCDAAFVEKSARELDFCFRPQKSSSSSSSVEREKREFNPIGNGTTTRRWFKDSECCTSVPPRPRVPQLALLGNKTLVPFFET